MSDTKLRPEDLRAKAEALIAFTREGPLFIAWVQAVTDTLAPAPEKAAKVECPNCGEMTSESHADGILFGAVNYTCQPAQPKPAAPEKGAWIADGFGNTWKKCERENCGLEIVRPGKVQCALCESESVEPAQPEPEKAVSEIHRPVCLNCWQTDTGHGWKVNGELRYSCASTNKPAQPEPAAPEMPPMPNAVHNLVLWCQMLSASQYGQGFRSQIKADLDAFTDWWRTNSQPVAHPFKAGFKPDSMRHFAEYVRDNWHYFGTDTAGLAHQFLQEMAAQPVAVGMTEELEHILSIAERDLRYKEECFEDSARTEPDERIERLRAAIAAVRQQAAQGRKVELPTARKTLEYMRRCAWADATYEQIDAALAELDATEGRE